MGVVAIPDNSRGAVVFHRDGKRLLRLGPQEDVRFCAVSPDGRWVATGSHGLREGAGAKVWDAREGGHVKDLPVAGMCRVQFSPDGQWLLTTGGRFRLWAVGTWEEGPSLGGSPLNPSGAFSCDGKLLALGDTPGVVRLVVTDAGAEIARLTAPEQERLLPGCFTPDGTQLVATGIETGALYVFDLRAIRAGLAELDLDWDAPSLPDAPSVRPEPLRVEVNLGNLRERVEADRLVASATRLARDKKHAESLAALRQAIETDPSHAAAHNNLAWLLLTGPKELRDPAQALPEAQGSRAGTRPVPLSKHPRSGPVPHGTVRRGRTDPPTEPCREQGANRCLRLVLPGDVPPSPRRLCRSQDLPRERPALVPNAQRQTARRVG